MTEQIIAVDTNIIVRLFVEDHGPQVALARKLLATRGFHLLPGVVMEAEWVLRSIYRWDRARINSVFVDLLAMANVTTEDAESLRWALTRHAEGADLADMLHLAAAKNLDAFATFDQTLKHAAGPTPPVAITALP